MGDPAGDASMNVSCHFAGVGLFLAYYLVSLHDKALLDKVDRILELVETPVGLPEHSPQDGHDAVDGARGQLRESGAIGGGGGSSSSRWVFLTFEGACRERRRDPAFPYNLQAVQPVLHLCYTELCWEAPVVRWLLSPY